MSDDCKCEHNNHDHFLIYFFIFCSLFFPSCVDCTGEKEKMKKSVSRTDENVERLDKRTARDVSDLNMDVSDLYRKVNAQKIQIDDLKEKCK